MTAGTSASGDVSVDFHSEKNVVFGPEHAGGAGVRLCSITHDMLGDPFWAVYRQGLSDAAQRYGCLVHHRAPRQFSPAEMVAHLRAAVGSRPDGILATIPDAAVVEDPLREAIALGIPVIAVNAVDPRPAGQRIPYLLYIGADDVLGGRVAAQQLLASGAPRRGVCVDHYETDNACHSRRYTGFSQVLDEAGLDCLRVRVPGHDPDRAIGALRAALQAGDAVCTLGPPGAELASAALRAERIADRTSHGSFDVAPQQLDAVESGELRFTIDSQQYLQGYLGVALLSLHITCGFTLAGDVLTGPAVIDASGAASARAGVQAGYR